MNQLFIVGLDVLNAVSLEEVEATALALKELDLYKLPYDRIDLQLPFDGVAICAETGKSFTRPMGPAGFIMIKDLSVEGHGIIYAGVVARNGKRYEEPAINQGQTTDPYAALIITVLASRNIVKKTREHKLAKLGIGKNRGYRYSTTISLPKNLDDDTDNHTQGQPKCPHLRRGHIRRQHYGPKGCFEKKIWIAPVFVNADKDYVSTRTHYNLGV